MIDELKELQNKFEAIKDMGWIKEKRKSTGSCGYTFESLLSKEEDNFPVPDYHNIEIKTMNNHSKNNLHLFNLIPDGDYLFPIERMLHEIGCPNKDNSDYKVLYRTFKSQDYTKLVFGRKGIIKVNYEREKVELIVLDHHNENININISWSFAYIKERLLLKLKYLALVMASSRIIDGAGYYHYYDISYYELKSFEDFIHLVDNGIIEITFKIGVHKSGKKIGKVYDHGTDFSINAMNLELLYNKINLC